MMRKWMLMHWVVAGLFLAMLGTISCGDQGSSGTGDETAQKYKKGSCG